MPKQFVVVVDPVSTGLHVAREIIKRGYSLVVVHSTTINKPACISNMPVDVATSAVAEIHHHGIDATLRMLRQYSIIGVLAGCETGVTLADTLSDRLGLATNGANGAAARRNKYLMGEQIRSAGLRAVKQCTATTWEEIVHFVDHVLKPTPFEVIVKPVESAGSDDVFLCHSMNEVHRAFSHIQGHVNQLGSTNTATLVQEYLVGTEYVVDTVSRNGMHKVVAMWEYEKGPANGAPFVYFAVRLVEATSAKHLTIMEYTLKVLDALHIRHGPAHAEVKWVNNEPCLVEVGARCHGNGGYFLPAVNRCIGYNQVSVTVDSYFNRKAFESIPTFPGVLRAYSCEVALISYTTGTLLSCPGISTIEKLPSFLFQYLTTHVGQMLVPTIDVFTKPGSVWLLHSSKEVVEQDIKRIRGLEMHGMWNVQPLAP